MKIRSSMLVLLVVLGIRVPVSGQSKDFYAPLWKVVDSLTELNQPRSALKVVDDIYRKSKSDRNDPQMIKAVMYRIRLNSDFQENFMKLTIRNLRDEMAGSGSPAKQILQSVLAEVFWKYYQNNMYRYRDRTRMEGMVPDSVETWDLKTISEEVTRNYLLSLKDPEALKKMPIGKYSLILDCGLPDSKPETDCKTEAAKYCPTLFDFLAGRALDFFASDAIPAPTAKRFEIDLPDYFAPTARFISGSLTLPADTSDPRGFALRIYRDLAAFHATDKDPRALIETELMRLMFVHTNYVYPSKDSLYRSALLQMEKIHQASPWSAAISFALADFLNTQSNLYQPLNSTNYKWDRKAALDVCNGAVKRHPGSEGASNCERLSKEIRSSGFNLSTESAVPVGQISPAAIHFRNLNRIYFRLVKISPETFREQSSKNNQKELLRFLTKMSAVKSWSQDLPNDGDYQEHSAEIAIPGIPAGFYVLLGSSYEDFKNPKQIWNMNSLWATQISYVNKSNRDGTQEFYILDRTTGLPLKGARAEIWIRKWDYTVRQMKTIKLNDYTCDDDGHFSIPAPEDRSSNFNLFMRIYGPGDDFLFSDTFFQYPYYGMPESTMLNTRFYTDRAIYRPGQTVSFKGIIIEKKGEHSALKAFYPTKVMFNDVNGQKISEIQLTTNAFGSFSGTFTAPVGSLPGEMTIYNESGSVSFSVEEYRRPTFEVTSEPLNGNYRLDKPLTYTAKATAYSGNAITGAKVSYRVVRSARYPFFDWGWYRFRPYPSSPEAEVASGTMTTGPDGSFSITFPAIPDRSVDPVFKPVFTFHVTADVTDLNGETQSSEESISVGYNCMTLNANLPEQVNLAADSILKISAVNLNGRKTTVDVSVVLSRLRQPGRILHNRLWERPDTNVMTAGKFRELFPNDIFGDENNPEKWPVEETVFEKYLNTATDSIIHFTGLSSLKSMQKELLQPGSYCLTLKANDPFGQPVEKKLFFTAFMPASTGVPLNTPDWFVPLKTSGEPGEKAHFLIGSGEDNVNVLFEVRNRDSLVSREWIRLGNQVKSIEIPILERYRGGFSVNFLFVRNNRSYQHSTTVDVPYTNKKLDLSIASFRDKIDPGSRETWTISIRRPGGNPARAEFMAGMYDASLDQFRQNEWSFGIYEPFHGYISWEISDFFGTSGSRTFGNETVPGNYIVHPEIKLDWFGLEYFNTYFRRPRMAHSADKLYKSQTLGAREEVLSSGGAIPQMDATAENLEVPPPPPMTSDTIGERLQQKPSGGLQVRRDFRETAFFYPAIMADSVGNIVLQFTAPESLTRWKMMGLAHTRDLEYGLIEKELVTRKLLMVFPNAPRFLRQGDTAVLSTRITNLSGQDLSGEARLELTNGITLEPMDGLTVKPGTLPFSILKGQSTSVSWKIIIPVNPALGVLQYRITAVSGSFSDGEEKAIPVLTNRMMVTETLPLPVRGKGTTEFSFDKLKMSGVPEGRSMKNYRLTLEFASNPAWYAVQALPSLNDKQYESADAIFAAYWSNSLASHIANSSPKISAVFDAWKNLTPEALQSNLEKNEDLKSALIRETPWVRDAAGETARKQKLGQYFDRNTIETNLRENLTRLQKLQTPGGGWTWFPGMPENRYTTQNIVTGLGKLLHLGVIDPSKDPSLKSMITRAISYLDRELAEDYRKLREQKQLKPGDNHLGSVEIQYLYARSFFVNTELKPLNAVTNYNEAFEYYVGQAEKYWKENDRMLQGMIALALDRFGRKSAPGLIMKSLSERALHSDEMGTYWAEESGYWWHRAPVETQAMMIEAFDDVSHDSAQVEEMKIWLLKQKQTQGWRSSNATLQACYALLLRGTDFLSGDPGVKISVGKEKINPSDMPDLKQEAGTGYFRYSWQGSEIRPEMGTVSVSRSGKGAAWGALYWQYFEDLDRITPAATPLKLEKRLFAEQNSPKGPVLRPVETDNEALALQVGDKIVVRVVVTVDRDLEFVHLKDMRASAFEPVTGRDERNTGSLSGYRYQDGLGYYQSVTDQSVNFFFDYLPKGTHVLEYSLKANTAGEYSNGITTIQCMYAPEFAAHSEGIRVSVR